MQVGGLEREPAELCRRRERRRHRQWRRRQEGSQGRETRGSRARRVASEAAAAPPRAGAQPGGGRRRRAGGVTGQVTSQVTERWPRGDEWAAHPGEGGTAGRGVTVPAPHRRRGGSRRRRAAWPTRLTTQLTAPVCGPDLGARVWAGRRDLRFRCRTVTAVAGLSCPRVRRRGEVFQELVFL